MTGKPPSPDRSSPDAALWTAMRRLTAARIGLKRTGASLATGPLLDFQLAHTRARDAVHAPLDAARLTADVGGLGMPVLEVASAIEDQRHYLMRPDLGCRLAPDAEAMLTPYAGHYDVAFVISGGLSARAVQTHAAPVLAAVLPALRADGCTIAPLVIVASGRVAIGDCVAAALHADSMAMLIGERPGLTAPDSMGAYLTWRPSPRTTDAERNCISTIRPDGIGYADDGFKIVHILRAMRTRRLSGVQLKDGSDQLSIGRE